jgi:hypothetical protein
MSRNFDMEYYCESQVEMMRRLIGERLKGFSLPGSNRTGFAGRFYVDSNLARQMTPVGHQPALVRRMLVPE